MHNAVSMVILSERCPQTKTTTAVQCCRAAWTTASWFVCVVRIYTWCVFYIVMQVYKHSEDQITYESKYHPDGMFYFWGLCYRLCGECERNKRSKCLATGRAWDNIADNDRGWQDSQHLVECQKTSGMWVGLSAALPSEMLSGFSKKCFCTGLASRRWGLMVFSACNREESHTKMWVQCCVVEKGGQETAETCWYTGNGA